MIDTTSRARLRLTVVDPGRTASADLLLDVPAGTPFAEVRPDLGVAPDGGRARFRTDTGPVPDDAVVGRPPLVDGAVLVVDGSVRRAPARGPTPLVEVHVVGGLHAGDRVGLPLGRHVVGRGPDCAVRLDDPDVSRAHAVVEVRPDGVRVADLGSANGTALVAGGSPVAVGGSAAPWPVGATLLVGGTRLVVRSPGADAEPDAPASTVPDGLGHLLVNRAPRVSAAPDRPVVRWPDAPPEAPTGRLPWAALLLPAVLAVPMALVWRQPSFLLLGLLSPLAVLGQHLLERRGGRRAARRARADHDRALAQVRERLTGLTAQDLVDLERERPDPARIAAAAGGPSVLLWQRCARDDDAWLLRLGRGPVPVRVDVAGPHGDAPDDLPGLHPDGPVTVDLRTTPVLGITGPREATLSVARSLLGQAAVLRSPLELTVEIRAARGRHQGAWDWAEWLPHNGSATGAASDGAPPDAAVPDRAPAPRHGTAAGGSERLVVLDGAQALRREPGIAELLALARSCAEPATGTAARRPRTVVVCLDEDPSRLPAECSAVLGLDDRGRGVLRCAAGTSALAADGAGAGWAARLGRDLARLRDATPGSDPAALAVPVQLPDLLGLPAREAGDAWAREVGDRWARCSGPPRLQVVLGTTSVGPWEVDLRRDGPHALVAGTTGSGKSELLRSLVAALAVEHPPTQVSMLLVDYKGGTAFAGLDRLPHVSGLLTDLDQRLARRALTCLHAELRRRERLLRRHGAADLDAYDRLPTAGREPVPRLVVVVDEFRTLADDLPDLLAGLVRVAALGRSLGVHLVLATQRPAGAVTADMRANLNLRVALRVRDRADSDDVVEAPDAAALTPDRPGHGFVRSGGGELVPVRVGLLADPPDHGGPRVTRLRPAAAGLPRHDAGGGPAGPGAAPVRPGAAGSHDDPDEARRAAVGRLVAACTRAVVEGRVPLPAPPWLPPLPELVTTDDLQPTGAPQDGAGCSVLLGLMDLPDEQRRAPLLWDPAAGHLAVVGGPGSGRSSTLRTVVAGLLGGGVHVHVLTGAQGLAAPPAAPGTGTLVPVSDVDRAARLLRHLAREPLPGRWTVLVVDGWESVVDTLGGHDRGRPLDDLVALVRDRGADGVRLAAAGGRALLSGQVGALLGQRLLLRTVDPTDLLVAGLAPEDVPATMPPGRCVVLGSAGRRPVEAQVALLDADPSPAAQDAALRRSVAASHRPDAHGGTARRPERAGPLRLLPLPARVLLDDLRGPAAGTAPVPDDIRDVLPHAGPAASDGSTAAPQAPLPPPAGVAAGRLDDADRLVARHVTGGEAAAAVPPPGAPDGVVVGLGGDAAGPVSLPLPPGGVVLVAGTGGTGRSTALTVVGLQAADAGRPVIRAEDLVTTTGGASRPGCVVLVDDLDRVPPEARCAVEGLVAGGATAVVATTPADAAVAYSGLLATGRSTGCGLLLGPLGPGDGEALGVRSVGSSRAGAPGRGLLVVRGSAVPVQVADPAPRPAPPGRRGAGVDDTVGPARS